MDGLGDRMKNYEKVSESFLTPRMPAILRIDGKAFHTWTKKNKCLRPFDEELMGCMAETTRKLCENISGSVFGYTQSDEISILIKDYQTLQTESWFDGKIVKMVSVAASLATGYFNDIYKNPPSSGEFNRINKDATLAFFDARVFNVPKEDVVNYFIWRQNDAVRNSVQMLARSVFSHGEMKNKSNEMSKAMLLEKGIDWNKLEGNKKRGTCVYKKIEIVRNVERRVWKIDTEIPRFSEEREYIGNHV